MWLVFTGQSLIATRLFRVNTDVMKQITICCAIVLLAVANTCAIASDLNVQLLDGNTGRPLKRKKVCISFTPAPRANGLDSPSVCSRTDANGSADIKLPVPEPQTIQLAVLTNDLLPCFAIPNAFSVSDLMAKGEVAKNTCAGNAHEPTARTGSLTACAHQMTFLEVLKSMWHEL